MGINKPLIKCEADRIRVNEGARRHREKYPLICRMRSRIAAFLRNGTEKKSWHTMQYLGCTKDEYRVYIEAKFTRGMTWKKLLDGKIHIDHIVPVSWFGHTEDELRKAFHFTNTQPMWAKDNIRKGNRIKAAQPDLFAGIGEFSKDPVRKKHKRRRA